MANQKSFLDLSGVSYLWSKIKSTNFLKIWDATCIGGMGEDNVLISINSGQGTFSLQDYSLIRITFQDDLFSPSDLEIQISGSQTTYPIKYINNVSFNRAVAPFRKELKYIFLFKDNTFYLLEDSRTNEKRIYFGYCSSAKTLVNKTVSWYDNSSDYCTIADGTLLMVYFTRDSSKENMKLGVTDKTNTLYRYPMMYNGSALPASYIKANKMLKFKFVDEDEDSYWEFLGDWDSDAVHSDGSVSNMVSLTSTEFDTLKNNNQLVEGTVYNIIDDNGENNMDAVPVGTILSYGSSSAPTGYLNCDGSAVSRTIYADLFTIIGTSYGAGDGSTTFNLPNLKGKVPVGLNSSDSDFNSLGKSGGNKTHSHTQNSTTGSTTLTAAQSGVPAHSHTLSGTGTHGHTGITIDGVAVSVNNGTSATGYGVSITDGKKYSQLQVSSTNSGHTHTINDSTAKAATSGHTHTLGSTDSSSSLQPYQTVNFIIKAYSFPMSVTTTSLSDIVEDKINNYDYTDVVTETINDVIVKKTYSYAFPTTSAGAKGYFTVTVQDMSNYTLLSSYINTGNIANSGGLQLTPVYFPESSTTGYVNYYAPSAFNSGNVTIYIVMFYIKNS